MTNTPYMHHITEPAAWTPDDLAKDRSWDITLTQRQSDELVDALAAVKKAGVPLARLGKADFPLPASRDVTEAIREQLKANRGFALLHGFPVEGHPLEDVERMYWGFCAYLGIGLTQNSDSTLIHYVTEGKLRPNQGTRGVGNPGKVSLHVDLADCVSLLCVRQPADNPPSRLSSSLTLHNMLLERHPESLARLYEGFFWDRQNEHGEGETPTSAYRVPFFSEKNGVVSCRYNRNWITKAANRNGGFSVEEEALLDLIDGITHETCFEFPFNPGDVQFASNYTMLHGRAPHAPTRSDEEARLLMRIWFDIENMRDFADESIVRYGIIRHGRLGWTAPQLAEGIDGKLHARRADGAPLIAAG